METTGNLTHLQFLRFYTQVTSSKANVQSALVRENRKDSQYNTQEENLQLKALQVTVLSTNLPGRQEYKREKKQCKGFS